MKKIVLGICDNKPNREKNNGLAICNDVVKLIIIDTETEKEELELPVITLKPNAYNRLSWEVVRDLLSPYNQIYILVAAGDEDNHDETEIIDKNVTDVRNRLSVQEFSLTRQQRVIMDLVDEGFIIKQIAEKLCLSYHTVKHHYSNIKGRMGVRSMPEALDVYKDYKKRMN